MISSIAWVPAGVADPNPKKYELSSTERELIAMMEGQTLEDAVEKLRAKGESRAKGETVRRNDLPADLRMDEYSSDEDDEDAAVAGTMIGGILVDDGFTGEDMTGPAGSRRANNPDEDGESDDDDGDDDLADVPDTREFMPLDVEGLTAMGITGPAGADGADADFMNEDDEDDASETQDVNLNPDDAIVVVAKTDEDFAALEVHVYEQTRGNLFVHHDIPLPAFPLCLAHGDISPSGTAGNFCAVGTFSPGIEVWNLDVLNALEPSCVLGGEDTSMADELMRQNILNEMGQPAAAAGGKRKNKKSRGGPDLKPGSHTDAIMALSWNTIHRQVIASGSADCTVKLWDITKSDTTAGTFTHHEDKVQSVEWHPKEGTLLATGSYDRTVALIDARGNSKDARKVNITADCESVAWDPQRTHCLTVASEDGRVTCWDVRKFSTNEPLWSFLANEHAGVSDISYNRHVPGMMATCSPDKTVALWDAHGDANTDANATTSALPVLCGNKDMGVGKLYTVNFYPSSPWLLGCAGSGNELSLWDMSQEVAIQKRFVGRVSSTTNAIIREPEKDAELAPAPIVVPAPAGGFKKKKNRNRNKKKAHKKR